MTSVAAPPVADHDAGFGKTYLWSTDHKVIAMQYLFTGMLMALIGGFGWIEAAAAGVIAVGAAAVLFPFPHQGMLTSIAFLGGLVSVALRAVLLRVGILLASP